jgi:hypothetical protein
MRSPSQGLAPPQRDLRSNGGGGRSVVGKMGAPPVRGEFGERIDETRKITPRPTFILQLKPTDRKFRWEPPEVPVGQYIFDLRRDLTDRKFRQTTGSSSRGPKTAGSELRSGVPYDILKPTQKCPDFMKSTHNYGHIRAVKNRF